MGTEDYLKEARTFDENFNKFLDRRIVLYGIGRFSATLIPLLKDKYHFVGLMDRDPNNVGKIMFGLKIMDLKEAERCADLIIINTTRIYWNVIYSRICKTKLPVYFLNGQKAKHITLENYDSDWRQNSDSLLEKLSRVDIVSFDIFDTLLTRKVCFPEDVFSVLADRLIKKGLIQHDFDFVRIRIYSKSIADNNASLREIYEKIQEITGFDSMIIENIYSEELAVEREVSVPRIDLIKICKRIMESNMPLFFMSDMYLPKKFLVKLLREHGLTTIDENNVWISYDKSMSKKDGTLWELYKKNIVCGKKAVHIGDDLMADVINPHEFQIETFRVMSGYSMFEKSSMKEICPAICTQYQALVMGVICARLFNSPFSLCPTKGKVRINSRFDMGYCVLGPVILTFVLWLIKKTYNKRNLYFFARDGYFLIEVYQHVVRELGISAPKGIYLPISRQLIWIASIETEDDLKRILKLPYIGSFEEFLRKRFDVIADIRTKDINNQLINISSDYDAVKKHVNRYKDEIWNNIKRDRNNYLEFLKQFDFKETFGVVDLGYHGTIQKYLSKLLNAGLKGYYLSTNYNDINAFGEKNFMESCYPWEVNNRAGMIREGILFLESFLTAPYGMITRINENGDMVCDDARGNQKFFKDKEEIQDGIIAFCNDVLPLINIERINILDEINFVDHYYGMCIFGSMEFSNNIKRSFLYDNTTFHEGETSMFI